MFDLLRYGGDKQFLPKPRWGPLGKASGAALARTTPDFFSLPLPCLFGGCGSRPGAKKPTFSVMSFFGAPSRGLRFRAKLFEHERHPILSIFSTPLFSAGVVLVPAQKKTPPVGDVFLFGAPIRA